MIKKYFDSMILKLKVFILNVLCQITYCVYWLYIYVRVPIIRRKKSITVLFMLQEVAAWKTELLYIAMLKHPRFNPVIGITNSKLSPNDKPQLIDYLQAHNYHFFDLDDAPLKIKEINADFVFYYKPYIGQWNEKVFFFKNRKTIPLSIDYGLSITDSDAHVYRMLYVFSYMFFADNKNVKDSYARHIGFKGHNIVVTGTPIQDFLLKPKEDFTDPWKDQDGRKRIIYAPHHSIPDTNFSTGGRGIEYATILQFGELLLELAEKYKDRITIAFKPHPALYMKLIRFWGEEKTRNYYDAWENGENTQLETGDYIGLFKYSDAMIHDSSSFIAEYQCADKPSLFLVRGDGDYVPESLNDFGKSAYGCHEIAKSAEQIEAFVVGVIHGVDSRQAYRSKFITEYMLPPNGKTACENIIDTILGK